MSGANYVEFDLSSPEGAPLFTIAAPVHGSGRYVRQTRCPSDVGIVSLRLEPHIVAKRFAVEWLVDENAIPRRFMPAVVEGIKAGLEQFTRRGTIINIKVSVIDGAYHEIDSRERSYTVAAQLAFDDAMAKASLIEMQTPVDTGTI